MTPPASLGSRFVPRARLAWVLCALLTCTGCLHEDDEPEDVDAGNVLGSDDGGAGTWTDVSATALDGGAHGDLDAALWADISRDSSAPVAADSGIPDGSALPSGQLGHPDEIETVVTEYYDVVGVGGAPIRDVRPVVLLKNGYATRSTNVLITSFDLDADRAKLPGNWFRWRLVDGQIELQNGTQWVRLSSQARFPPLPPGFRFERSFERLTGTSVLIAKSYTFRMDGSFRYYAAASTRLVTPVDERGTYEIERYLLRVKYNDGTSGVAALVYRPDLPVLFLSGLSYTAP